MYKCQRRHKRFRFHAIVEVIWTDPNGSEYSTIGRGIDVSEAGMAVEVSQPLLQGIWVSVSLNGTATLGRARIVYSLGTANGFRTGMEFDAPVAVDELAGTVTRLPPSDGAGLECGRVGRERGRTGPQSRRGSRDGFFRRLGCLILDHDFAWDAPTSQFPNLKCKRCDRVVPLYTTEGSSVAI